MDAAAWDRQIEKRWASENNANLQETIQLRRSASNRLLISERAVQVTQSPPRQDTDATADRDAGRDMQHVEMSILTMPMGVSAAAHGLLGLVR